MANKRLPMTPLINKIKTHFEWYRLCLPKHHKIIFDKILNKTDEQSIGTTPGGFEAVVCNQLIDMEERLRLLENY